MDLPAMTSLPANESVWDYPRPPRIEHIDWWRPLGATAEGQAVFYEIQQELARQLRRLRASDVPWLLEPEQWTPR
jgi:hypothetical protein